MIDAVIFSDPPLLIKNLISSETTVEIGNGCVEHFYYFCFKKSLIAVSVSIFSSEKSNLSSKLHIYGKLRSFPTILF